MLNKPKTSIYAKGITVAFLGPDGSGKSTIIAELLKQDLPFKHNSYFHLKPLVADKGEIQKIVEDPHSEKEYGLFKSTIKLLLFFFQYNFGWQFNILKLKSNLIIFDRYFDDLLVDHRRYRYGGSKRIAKLLRYLIPRPELYFILTTDAKVIHERKKEVSFSELTRQINEYRKLADGKRYFNIDVNRTPDKITAEILEIILNKKNESN